MAETVKKSKSPAKPKAATKKAAETKVAEKKVAAKPTPISNHTPSHDQIAELARKYWAERGYTDGNHEADWFRAEQELRAKAS